MTTHAKAASRVPFGEPAEPVEYEHTTVGREPCPACGEWRYPRRKTGSSGPFTFAPKCEVCGTVIAYEEHHDNAR